jgi:Cu2+-exporting ATPase
MESHMDHHSSHAPQTVNAEHGEAHVHQDDHMVHSHGQHAGHSTAMFKD